LNTVFDELTFCPLKRVNAFQLSKTDYIIAFEHFKGAFNWINLLNKSVISEQGLNEHSGCFWNCILP